MYKIPLFILLNAFVTTTLFSQMDFSESNRISHPLLTELDNKITAGDYEEITSILVSKDGKLIFENYYNSADVSTKHNTRSVTKTMATLLTGIAIDKGFIKSEKDPILSYLKDRRSIAQTDPRKSEITIEDLLSMSSILECDDNNQFSRGNEERMYIIEDWLQFYLDLPVKSYPFGPKPAELPHGRSWSYCTAGAAAMAEVIQSAVGMPVADFHKENLLQPLGIEDYTLHYAPNGTLNTAGGSEYRSRDFLKIIQMCLNKGRWNGKQIISADWIEKASSPHSQAWPGMEYGYLFWLHGWGKDQKVPAFAMSGNGGQKMIALPQLNATVVITTTNYGNRNAHNYADDMMNNFIVPALADN